MASEFKLSVCPHDTAKNLVGWYTLNTYMQRRLDVGISFQPDENFLVERQKVLDSDFHIVFANPFSAVCFARQKGFVPVARVVGSFDETVVIAKPGTGVPDSPRIASATDKLIIHGLGLHVLETLGIDAGKATFSFVGNHLAAAKAVLQGEADLGFVYNETWASMAQSTRTSLQVLGESTGGLAFHCFMVSSGWADKREAVQNLLCKMHEDPAGQAILKDLSFPALEPVGAEALEALNKMVDC